MRGMPLPDADPCVYVQARALVLHKVLQCAAALAASQGWKSKARSSGSGYEAAANVFGAASICVDVNKENARS